MRPKVTLILLVVMLAAIGVGLFLRRGASHASAPAAPSASASAPEASASAVGSAPAPKNKGPQLGRALRVTGLGWELLAPAVMANDGATAGKDSRFKKAGLGVELSAHGEVTQVENALARGGDDEKGADVAVLPLQRFVASYERLKALNPVIFFVVGWSDGGEIILSKKASFEELPPQGDVKLRATAGEPAAFLGLYAFDLAGVTADRVKLVSDGEAEWSALTRREAKQRSEQTSGNLLLSTAEASQLVPFVAVAQASLLQKNPDALAALAEGWLGGHELLAQNPTAASRKIGDVKGAPEPLAVLARLGEIRAASLSENAELAGLAGRGAVTLEALFHRTWQIWRSAKVLSIPPEQAPIDGTIIATLVRMGGKLTPAPSPPRKGDAPRTEGKPLISYYAPKGKLDETVLVDTIGFVAGVFPRSPIRVTVHPQGAPDKKQSEKVVLVALERFALAEGRLKTGTARPKPTSPATIEVMPVP